ncbi:MAG: glutathione peroxidase [Chloroflexus aggregans]|uniref:Glutathione peroxidase n=1 Tax=Chloroflexus aggregans TaxID=152260 RepID=A0A2J6X6K2_9CHLR|nr:MAG: glutathione peroxidase [Chloroflexus aggregans]
MSIYQFTAQRIDGTLQPLSEYRGQVLLIVNVASMCGLSPQYVGLEQLYRRYRDQGFAVLGFPSNQFMQEPGSNEAIAEFCERTYQVTFPLFAKVDVNGPNEHPLFAYLKRQQPGLFGSTAIKWNFTKFLVDRNGKPYRRYAPTNLPSVIENDIVALLRQQPATVG